MVEVVQRSLTDAQRNAVEHPSQYLQILAGPGTGKTLTLSSRIAHFVQDRAIPPSEILALTFTNSAAATLKARLKLLLGDSGEEILVNTYHGFSNYLISLYEPKLNLRSAWTVADEWDQKLLIQGTNVDMRQLQTNNAYQLAKREMRGYSSYAEADSMLANPDIYRKRLRAANMLDYDDLLDYGLRISRIESPGFHHIFADEFQDASVLQWMIISNLVRKSEDTTLSVVGDRHQRIYQFLPSHYKDPFDLMEAEFPSTQVLLDKNFRSSPEIVKLAEAILGEKLPQSVTDSGPVPKLVRCASPEMMFSHIPGLVKELIKESKYEPEKIAILAPTNSEVLDIKMCLEKQGILPADSFEKMLLANPLVSVVGTLFKYSLSPVNPHLLQLLRNGIYAALTPTMATSLRDLSKNYTLPVREILDKGPLPKSATRYDKLMEHIHELDRTAQLLLQAVDGDYVEEVSRNFVHSASTAFPLKADPANAPKNTAMLERFFEWIRTQAQMEDESTDSQSKEPYIARAVRYLRYYDSVTPKGVKVATMHSAKGEEYSAVILSSKASGFAMRQRIGYVAATRAKERLYMYSTDPVPEFLRNINDQVLKRSALLRAETKHVETKYPALYAPLPIIRSRNAFMSRRRFHTSVSRMFMQNINCVARLI